MDGQILQTKSMFFYLIIPSPHLNGGSSSTRPYFSAVISFCDIADCIRWCIMLFSSISIGFWIPSLDLSVARSINQGALRRETFWLLRRKGNLFKFCVFLQHPMYFIQTPHQAWTGGQQETYRSVLFHQSYLLKQELTTDNLHQAGKAGPCRVLGLAQAASKSQQGSTGAREAVAAAVGEKRKTFVIPVDSLSLAVPGEI